MTHQDSVTIHKLIIHIYKITTAVAVPEDAVQQSTSPRSVDQVQQSTSHRSEDQVRVPHRGVKTRCSRVSRRGVIHKLEPHWENPQAEKWGATFGAHGHAYLIVGKEAMHGNTARTIHSQQIILWKIIYSKLYEINWADCKSKKFNISLKFQVRVINTIQYFIHDSNWNLMQVIHRI